MRSPFKKKAVSRRKQKSVPRILAVDDEEVMGYLIRRVVDHLGYEMDWVTDCKEAFDRIERSSYDVILSDYRLPSMNGDAFYDALAARDQDLVRRVVFITGDTVSTSTVKFFKRSRVPYLSKPFNVNELENLIQTTVKAVRGNPA
ncbi:response regulator [bacterium]|nr:response regulator [bacterium]